MSLNVDYELMKIIMSRYLSFGTSVLISISTGDRHESIRSTGLICTQYLRTIQSIRTRVIHHDSTIDQGFIRKSLKSLSEQGRHTGSDKEGDLRLAP